MVGRDTECTEVARPGGVAGRAGGPASCAKPREWESGGSGLLAADRAMKPGDAALATLLSMGCHQFRAGGMLPQGENTAGNGWGASPRKVTGMPAAGGRRFWWFLMPAEWNARMRSLHGSGWVRCREMLCGTGWCSG